MNLSLISSSRAGFSSTIIPKNLPATHFIIGKLKKGSISLIVTEFAKIDFGLLLNRLSLVRLEQTIRYTLKRYSREFENYVITTNFQVSMV